MIRSGIDSSAVLIGSPFIGGEVLTPGGVTSVRHGRETVSKGCLYVMTPVLGDVLQAYPVKYGLL